MLKRKCQGFVVASAGIAMGIAGAGTASATVVLYDSHGFESSAGYTAGSADLTGQPSIGGPSNQWQQYGSNATNPPYPFAGVINYPASTQQLVGIADNNIGPNDYGGWFPGTYTSPNAAFTPGPSTNHVLVSWTEAYAAGATGNPFFGVDVFNGASTFALVGIDTTNNLLVVQNPTNTFELGSNFFLGTAGTYYNFLMDLNYTTQQYGIYVNGNLIDTEPFATAASQFTDADLLTYVLGNTNANGTGYFDNYLVTASATVPEPASFSLAVVASTLLLRRRRERSASLNV